MFRFQLSVMTALAGGLWAGSAVPAQAQTPASNSGPVSGYTSGSPLSRRPVVPATAISPSDAPGARHSLALPIFMTTINTPGIYGAYDFGIASLTLFNREPLFYPTYPQRAVIPAVTTTVTPVQRVEATAGRAEPRESVTPREPVRETPRETTLTAGGSLPERTIQPTRGAVADTATLILRAPRGAQITFQGQPVPAGDTMKEYVTPPLVAGREYRYDVVTRWAENGREVRRQREILVHAGDRLDIDLTQPDTERGTRAEPLPAPEPTFPRERSQPPRQSRPTGGATGNGGTSGSGGGSGTGGPSGGR